MHEFIYRERIAKMCSKSKRFADYGAGIGDMCIKVKQINNGADVTYYDLKGKTMDFARWRGCPTITQQPTDNISCTDIKSNSSSHHLGTS
jgi:ubiquinone/menaquinone biosynthesis C-methylase UbiE